MKLALSKRELLLLLSLLLNKKECPLEDDYQITHTFFKKA